MTQHYTDDSYVYNSRKENNEISSLD